MNKRGMIKLGVICLLIIALSLLILSVFPLSAQEIKREYNLGETIRMNLDENSNIKITTPSDTYIQKASGVFFLYLNEIGDYEIQVKGKKTETYNFAVVKEIKNSITSEQIQGKLKEKHSEEIHEKTISKTEIISLNSIQKENLEPRIKENLPEISERKISRAVKEIVVSSEEHFEEVLISTEIEEKIRIASGKEKIKIYWKEKDTYLDFEVYDTDNNGFIDRVEWIIPHLSTQTFEIIIEIISAEHLDENRNFIQDIYDSVKALDNVWSPEISNGEYVRITFEQKLSFWNDITIYPRIVSGNPRVEVYEINSNEKIAEFTDIQSNEYNKIYLTNLQGEQDSFDLRVVDGVLEFDHIIDPVSSNIVSSCDAQISQADRDSFPDSCDVANGNSLRFIDASQETHNYGKAGGNNVPRWGGVRIESVNTSIDNCNTIEKVYICFSWWRTS